MDTITAIYGLISGLISGVIASILCTLLSRSLKPKIVIADQIAKALENEKPVYRLKIVNRSMSYAKNIHITVQFIDRQNSSDRGIVVQTRPLKLVRKDFQFIEPYRRKDIEGRYAVRLKFADDIDALWEDPDHTSLEVSIYCENEVNGVGKVFKKVYPSKSYIHTGSYETGKSTEIIPN